MSSIDPGSARTAEDFVMLLRQARAMSERSFWQLEEAANAAGHDLEPAVLAEALGLATLPDEQLVVALLHACGYTDEQIEGWLDIRDRLAPSVPPSVLSPSVSPSMSQPVSQPVPQPVPPSVSQPVPQPVPQSVLPPPVPPSPLEEFTTPSPETPAAVPGTTRSRHSLRLPGRGTRRARGSWLRPVAMAALAVVVGIGGIAVIVASVGDGDDGSAIQPGAPRPGGPETAPPSALPSFLPSPPPLESPSATPTASPSPSASGTTPVDGVLRSGTVTLQIGQSLDLDGGGSDVDIIVYGAGDSIRADPSSRHFAPQPTATKQACTTTDGYQKTVQGLTAGTGVCVRTDRGSYAHITVTRTAPLGFSYVVWS